MHVRFYTARPPATRHGPSDWVELESQYSKRQHNGIRTEANINNNNDIII